MEHEHCNACGFDGARYDHSALLAPRTRRLVGARILRAQPRHHGVACVRSRTGPHVDEPSFPPIEDDLVDSAAASYAGADPDALIDTLDQQATRLAQVADDAGPDRWSRGLAIGADRSDVRRLLEHALHDSMHHLDDVDRGLARLRR